jgi:hypothetical protein
MRRFVIAAVAILALAVPTAAYAKTVSHAFTLAKGSSTGRVFKLTLAHKGRIQIVLRYSRIHNPKADLLINLRQAGDPDGNIILDTGNNGMGCTKAGDSYVCSIYLPGLAAGNWFVTVAKQTTAAVPVHLRLSWPAT